LDFSNMKVTPSFKVSELSLLWDWREHTNGEKMYKVSFVSARIH